MFNDLFQVLKIGKDKKCQWTYTVVADTFREQKHMYVIMIEVGHLGTLYDQEGSS